MNINLQNLVEGGTAPEDIYVLTREGLAELTKEIFKNVNNRIQERIVTTVDENSDPNHVPSATTVYDAVKNLSRVKNLTITSGNILEATITPDQNTVYAVRKKITDTKAALYIWIEGIGYIACGGEIDETPDLNVNAIPNDVIADIVANSYQETEPDFGDVPGNTMLGAVAPDIVSIDDPDTAASSSVE